MMRILQERRPRCGESSWRNGDCGKSTAYIRWERSGRVYYKKRSAGISGTGGPGSSYAEYRIAAARSGYDIHDSEGSIGFLKEARDMLSGMSPVEADIYIKKICRRHPDFRKCYSQEVNEAQESDRQRQPAPARRDYRREKERVRDTDGDKTSPDASD